MTLRTPVRALTARLLRLPSVVAAFCLLFALAGATGCTADANVTSPSPGGNLTVVPPSTSGSDDSPDASDARASAMLATPETGAGEAMAAVPVYTGSPLCNVKPAPGDCRPDDPTAQGCQLPFDAGDDPFASASDATTLACHVSTRLDTAGQPTCLPAGTFVEGHGCFSQLDCSPGLECVGTGAGTCRRYCCGGNSQCPDGFCDIQPVAAFTWTKVPVCMPKRPCTLLDPFACTLDTTCSVVTDDGQTSCVAVGGAKAGDSCDTDHCGWYLVCRGASGARRCYSLCSTGLVGPHCGPQQTCKGGLPLFPDPEYGICQ